jgi:hypothetical protein
MNEGEETKQSFPGSDPSVAPRSQSLSSVIIQQGHDLRNLAILVDGRFC